MIASDAAHPEILDACCGGRMMWFDKSDSRAAFVDKRIESLAMIDRSRPGAMAYLDVRPDVVADFTLLPFDADAFSLVVFDPPHLVRGGKTSWMIAKYGKLTDDWESEIHAGFNECWRVLRPGGTLIFKWSEVQIPLSRILPLAPDRPLFGNRCGKTNKLHWVVFLKPS